MKTGEWDQVDSELHEIGVELTWESEAACDTGESGGHQMVKITIGWGGELKGSEADIIKSFVINAHNLIGILDKLMDREGGVVWFNDGIRYLWRWHDGESNHHSVWVFFSDLGDKEGSHSRSSSTSERVCYLETLKAVTTFSFLSDNIKN